MVLERIKNRPIRNMISGGIFPNIRDKVEEVSLNLRERITPKPRLTRESNYRQNIYISPPVKHISSDGLIRNNNYKIKKPKRGF